MPPSEDELVSCPFCAGREDRTPPETLRLGDPWRVRVVPNLYPAFDRQEVVVHAPRHVRSLAELSAEELGLVARAWRARRAAAPDGYLHVFVNDGAAAGASLPHSHSQLVWFAETPPGARHAVDRTRWVVAEERDGLVLACPWASRVPYEAVVAPAAARPDAFSDDLLEDALRLARDALRQIGAAAGPVAANVWLHDGSDWHLEILPRLGILAGIELGAGVYLNPTPPQEAARALRCAGR